jgi:hypothetical protein
MRLLCLFSWLFWHFWHCCKLGSSPDDTCLLHRVNLIADGLREGAVCRAVAGWQTWLAALVWQHYAGPAKQAMLVLHV